MSALTLHLRVLRAEAEALRRREDECSDVTACIVLGFMAQAKEEAANALESEERELEGKLKP